ncbi:MAG: S49 family peptidase [Acidovorax sp.]|nr:S49 family peptidase [Acidovorax sp.]
MLEPGYARIFFAALGPRLGVAALTDVQGFTTPAAGLPAQAASYNVRAAAYRGDKSFALINGIAVIPVEGTLVHKSGYVGSSSGVMGYDGLEAQIKSAIADPDVKGIMLDVDSPGGEVAGVQELGRVIANSPKLVWAHANEQSASAAYWLTSAADRVLLTESAEVGSIGVLMAHGDYSRALENEGIKVTLIFSGAHKVDGNPYEALPEAVLADFQADLDQLRGVFTSTVAGFRNIPTSQVLATEARMYRGKAAVKEGLADAVMSFDDAMAAFSETLAKKGGFTKGKTMRTADSSASPNTGEGMTHEQHTTAVAAARAEGHAAGVIEGTTKGATDERARIGAILTHANAAGREATAREFALSTNMDAETAGKLLATVPADGKAAAAAAAATTLNQMASGQQVSSEGGGDGGAPRLTLAQRNAAARESQKRA